MLDGAAGCDALHAATTSLRVELVLTAHPTAITRRTLIQKHLRIAGALAAQDRVDLTAPERADNVAAIRREVLAAWERLETWSQLTFVALNREAATAVGRL